MRFHLRCSVRSDRGVRRDNQDAAYASSRLIAIADGMGGHPVGDVAASLVISAFARLDLALAEGDPAGHLRSAVIAGDDAIRAYVMSRPEHAGTGTTLTAAVLCGGDLGFIHVGDSRAYVLRNGRLTQLTRDDTLVQQMVDTGVIRSSEARGHPRSSVVTRVLVGEGPHFSLFSIPPMPQDRLLLCSDGISDVLDDEDLSDILATEALDSAADALVAQALARGTRDNVTCVVAEVAEGAAAAQPVAAGAFVMPSS